MYPQGIQSGSDGLSPSVLHHGRGEGEDKTTFQGIFRLQLLQVWLQLTNTWFGLVNQVKGYIRFGLVWLNNVIVMSGEAKLDQYNLRDASLV